MVCVKSPNKIVNSCVNLQFTILRGLTHYIHAPPVSLAHESALETLTLISWSNRSHPETHSYWLMKVQLMDKEPTLGTPLISPSISRGFLFGRFTSFYYIISPGLYYSLLTARAC